MSTKRRKSRYGNYSRSEQRRVMRAVTLLFAVSMASIAMMAVVNRLPIGNRYTYTNASDLWIVDGGEMQIAAPEVILYTEEPEATPTPEPTATSTATPTPTPTPTAEPEPEFALEALDMAEAEPEQEDDLEQELEADTDWGFFFTEEDM